MILKGVGDAVEGEKLVAIGRKISKPIIIPATARQRAQQVYIHGNPAKCYIDKPVRILIK
ncbi:MAG: hypothetical protein QW231_01085 [Candidatus Bathyarchaeia archaeon]